MSDTRVIHRVLIANRGEIACRIMSTCATMGLETVAVYSEPDVAAIFVRQADFAVPIGGTSPATSYLRIDAILDAAARSGADAVHPGYGFLSERPDFAQAVIDSGLVWIGPSPAAIAAMGSKIEARDRMATAGVEVVPGVDLTGVGDDHLVQVIAPVGWPVLVKASAGGGGRGMRIVERAEDLVDAVNGARREAASAFGDETVFVERYIQRPRHIEVQVFGDHDGTVIALFERECSIQRRHQKIIEEAPSPFVSNEVRAAMSNAAVRAAQAVDYVGAGTVEFIVDPDGRFYFLEMNTRLQVEHPVTEAICGLDLVRLQIEVACGHPLPAAATSPARHGHAIEARLYAEDPDRSYLPTPGAVHTFAVPAQAGVRVDTGVRSGDVIGTHYDPMLAKVIAHAPTRDEAARLLAHALRRTKIHGVVTNRELLVGVLEHDEFLAGATDTGFLDRHPPASLRGGRLDETESSNAAIAAALAQQARSRTEAVVLAAVPSGFRNNRSQLHERTYLLDDQPVVVGYTLGRDRRIEVNGVHRPDVVVLAAAPGSVELILHGVRQRFDIVDIGSEVWVNTVRGAVRLGVVFALAVDDAGPGAGSLVAPMPGTVVRVDAVVGAEVRAGEALVVIEAMKMEHTIVAATAGVVAGVEVEVGQVVDAGSVVAVVDAAGPGADVSSEPSP